MSFELTCLLGKVDIPAPSWADVVQRLDANASFILEGRDGEDAAFFQVDHSGQAIFVQVEGVGDKDQFALVDLNEGDALTDFFSQGDLYRYPAFALVDRDLIHKAISHFAQTGLRSPELNWMAVSELLQRYPVLPD